MTGKNKWIPYKLTLKIISPIHTGYRKVGNIDMCRRYIPSKTMWGAVTAALTRERQRTTGKYDYENVGNEIKQSIRFSYFYPTVDQEKIRFWPWKDVNQFDWNFMDSYASTAIRYQQFSALEGSLHETEFIRPCSRDGKQVYLLGYMIMHADKKNLKNEFISVLNLSLIHI